MEFRGRFGSNRQPKFSAKLDLAEHKKLEPTDIMEPSFGAEETYRGMNDDFKRSFKLEGMINLSGKGKRLAVMKLSDSDTERNFGRMQARFLDKVKENLKLIFVDNVFIKPIFERHNVIHDDILF